MGLSNFPSPAEGMLPVLVMNTVMSVAILKNLLRSVIKLVGAVTWVSRNLDDSNSSSSSSLLPSSNEINHSRRMRGVSITQFKNISGKSINIMSNSNCCSSSNRNSKYPQLEGRTEASAAAVVIDCCVCLCKFEDEEEVSELSCKHFFHRNCLEKWFDNHHSTCPLCRSIH